jgi:hypothetical protein
VDIEWVCVYVLAPPLNINATTMRFTDTPYVTCPKQIFDHTMLS